MEWAYMQCVQMRDIAYPLPRAAVEHKKSPQTNGMRH